MVEQAHVRQRYTEHHDNGGRNRDNDRAVSPTPRSVLANVGERELRRLRRTELEDLSHSLR